MSTPVVPDNVIKMWADPRFEILVEVDQLLIGPSRLNSALAREKLLRPKLN